MLKVQCLFYIEGTKQKYIAGNNGDRGLDSLLRDGWGIASITPCGNAPLTREDMLNVKGDAPGAYVLLEWGGEYPGYKD